jgi:hypothetical protein
MKQVDMKRLARMQNGNRSAASPDYHTGPGPSRSFPGNAACVRGVDAAADKIFRAVDVAQVIGVKALAIPLNTLRNGRSNPHEKQNSLLACAPMVAEGHSPGADPGARGFFHPFFAGRLERRAVGFHEADDS